MAAMGGGESGGLGTVDVIHEVGGEHLIHHGGDVEHNGHGDDDAARCDEAVVEGVVGS
jgi:hypothetical protein